MLSGLKWEICEEFTARLEWTKIADVPEYEGSWGPNQPSPRASNPTLGKYDAACYACPNVLSTRFHSLFHWLRSMLAK